MTDVVVVGGGLAGLAVALRLAKLGDRVTLVEAQPTLGGALGSIGVDGFRWDLGPSATLLPAVLRDLFRKTGRPLERELDLTPLPWIREHRFADGSRVRLPGGSRAAQVAAVDELGAGLGREWARYVDGLGAVWDTVRRGYAEPWETLDGDHAGAIAAAQTGRPRGEAEAEFAALAGTRTSLARHLARELRDPRLRELAGYPVIAAGQDLRRVPAWCGFEPYLEQRFGAWTAPGGLAAITAALIDRLAVRGVHVLTSTPATDVLVSGGRARGVATSATSTGDLEADAVVCAVDPRRLPVVSRLLGSPRSVRPATAPSVTHVGLAGDVADLGPELVLPGGLTVRATGPAWTILHRAPGSADPLVTLAGHGLDVRDQVVARVDRSPAEISAHGSPYGLLWRGRRTLRHRLGPTTPLPGLYTAGAWATPGPGVPLVGLSAALVTQALHPDAYR